MILQCQPGLLNYTDLIICRNRFFKRNVGKRKGKYQSVKIEILSNLASLYCKEGKQSRPVSADWTPSPYLPRHQVYLASKVVFQSEHMVSLPPSSQPGQADWAGSHVFPLHNCTARHRPSFVRTFLLRSHQLRYSVSLSVCPLFILIYVP